jgi:arylsulfatase
MLNYFPTKGMFNMMLARHNLWKERYPDRPQARAMPLTGIENARPETEAGSQPRVNPDDLPFDPTEFLKGLPDWENVDDKWGLFE